MGEAAAAQTSITLTQHVPQKAPSPPIRPFVLPEERPEPIRAEQANELMGDQRLRSDGGFTGEPKKHFEPSTTSVPTFLRAPEPPVPILSPFEQRPVAQRAVEETDPTDEAMQPPPSCPQGSKPVANLDPLKIHSKMQ